MLSTDTACGGDLSQDVDNLLPQGTVLMLCLLSILTRSGTAMDFYDFFLETLEFFSFREFEYQSIRRALYGLVTSGYVTREGRIYSASPKGKLLARSAAALFSYVISGD